MPLNVVKNGQSEQGKVKGGVRLWKDQQGYGFIAGDDGNEYFVHHTQIMGRKGRKSLTPGELVVFTPAKTEKGLQAQKVTSA